jgi:hypothetical protein
LNADAIVRPAFFPRPAGFLHVTYWATLPAGPD